MGSRPCQKVFFSRARAPWLRIPVSFPNQAKPLDHSSPGAWNKIWDLELQLKRPKCGSPLQELPFGCKRRRRTKPSERSSISWMCGCDEHPGSGTKLPWALGLQHGSKFPLHLSEPHRSESHAVSMDPRSTETPQAGNSIKNNPCGYFRLHHNCQRSDTQ